MHLAGRRTGCRHRSVVVPTRPWLRNAIRTRTQRSRSVLTIIRRLSGCIAVSLEGSALISLSQPTKLAASRPLHYLHHSPHGTGTGRRQASVKVSVQSQDGPGCQGGRMKPAATALPYTAFVHACRRRSSGKARAIWLDLLNMTTSTTSKTHSFPCLHDPNALWTYS